MSDRTNYSLPLTLSICSVIFLTALTSPGEAPSWTGWRGSNRDGSTEQFTPPKKWPEKLEKTWTTEVGDGYATPLVVGNRVYQHARQKDKEVLLCLDLKTGKVLWRKEAAIKFKAGRGGEKHGLGPKSTPTIADGRIFTLSITGILSAWSAKDGASLWTRDFKEHLEKTYPYWGASTSPIIDGDRLFVHPGSCESGALFCLDPKTGKDLWVRKDDPNCYSSPLVETIDGVRQLVELNHTGLCGIDVTNGKLLWKHSFPHHGTNQNTPTPARHKDLFIVGAEDRGMFAVRPKKTGDKWNVERVWRHRKVSFDMSSPIVADGLVYGFSQFKMGRISCLDPKTGEVLWEGPPRAGDNAQFISLPGHVLCLTDDGQLRVIAANGERFNPLKTYRVAEDNTWTAPALIGDTLLIKSGDHLSAWRFPLGNQ